MKSRRQSTWQLAICSGIKYKVSPKPLPFAQLLKASLPYKSVHDLVAGIPPRRAPGNEAVLKQRARSEETGKSGLKATSFPRSLLLGTRLGEANVILISTSPITSAKVMLNIETFLDIVSIEVFFLFLSS